MSYSFVFSKKGIIKDTVLKQFETILDGNGIINHEKFNNVIYCITNCTLYNNYTDTEIKNLLYDDLCDFMELHQDTLNETKNINFHNYFHDYTTNQHNKPRYDRYVDVEITFKCLIELQTFLYLCIVNDLSLLSSTNNIRIINEKKAEKEVD